MFRSADLVGDGIGQIRGDASLSTIEQTPFGPRHSSTLHVSIEHCLIVSWEQEICTQVIIEKIYDSRTILSITVNIY